MWDEQLSADRDRPADESDAGEARERSADQPLAWCRRQQQRQAAAGKPAEMMGDGSSPARRAAVGVLAFFLLYNISNLLSDSITIY